jgi:hypothetical protein
MKGCIALFWSAVEPHQDTILHWFECLYWNMEEVLRFPPGRGMDYDLGGSLLFVFFTSAIAWFAD